jgi:hypothetical protein
VNRFRGSGFRVPHLRSLACLLIAAATTAAPVRGQAPPVDVADCSKPGVVCGPPLPVVTSTSVVHEDRVEISVLGGIFGGGDLGDGRATMLTNDVPTSEDTSLFTTSARIDAAPIVEGRLGVRLWRKFWIEGGVGYAQPTFAVDISADVEGAPDVTASSTLTQVTADVGVQHRWSGVRFRPFVMGGAGYLRQLDGPRTTAETGWLAYGGGGMLVRVAPHSVGFWRHVALRGDVRVAWLRDGVVLNEQRGAAITAVAGVVVGFGGRVEQRP